MQLTLFFLSFPKKSQGMTMVESVVLIGIITFVSAIILVSFTGQNEGIALNRAARELALGIRKAQQTSLSIRKLPGDTRVPPRTGVRLTSRSSAQSFKYTLFADLDDTNTDGIPDGNFNFNAPPDVVIEELTFEKGVMVFGFEREDASVMAPPAGRLNIIFSSPEAKIDFSDNTGTKFTTAEPYIGVILISPGGKTKKIIIRSSGQVTVQ